MSEKKYIKTLELTVPVTIKGVEFNELKLPIPLGKDLRFLPENPKQVHDFYPMMCSCMGMTEEELDQMAANDLLVMMETFSNFLGNTMQHKPS